MTGDIATDSYLGRVVRAIDILLAALLFGARAGETISTESEELEGRSRFFSAMCWWLSLTVETDHCGRVRRGAPMSTAAGIRAAAQLVPLLYAVFKALDVAVTRLASALF